MQRRDGTMVGTSEVGRAFSLRTGLSQSSRRKAAAAEQALDGRAVDFHSSRFTPVITYRSGRRRACGDFIPVAGRRSPRAADRIWGLFWVPLGSVLGYFSPRSNVFNDFWVRLQKILFPYRHFPAESCSSVLSRAQFCHPLKQIFKFQRSPGQRPFRTYPHPASRA